VSDGTTIELYAKRIHRSNAKDVLETAENEIAYITNRLIALSCSAPTDHEDVDRRLGDTSELIEDLLNAYFRVICARAIIDFPEDCVDDYDPCHECGQFGFHKMSCGSKGES